MKNVINKYLIHFFISFFLSLTLYATDKIPEIGDKPPNILLPDLDGKLFNLNKIKNDGLTLISFSATYCKPCKEEIQEFMKLKNEYGENKIKIYLIFVDNDVETIKSYVLENKIDLKVLHDKYKIVSKKYGVTGLPVSFLINNQGIIIFKAIGYRKENIEIIKKEIEKL